MHLLRQGRGTAKMLLDKLLSPPFDLVANIIVALNSAGWLPAFVPTWWPSTRPESKFWKRGWPGQPTRRREGGCDRAARRGRDRALSGRDPSRHRSVLPSRRHHQRRPILHAVLSCDGHRISRGRSRILLIPPISSMVTSNRRVCSHSARNNWSSWWRRARS